MTVAIPKRFTIDDYHQLIELGFLTEGDRVELIRGELIPKASKSPLHTFCNSRLRLQFDHVLRDRVTIRCQDPILFLPHSEPEPDVVLAKGSEVDYLAHHPYCEDILLVVEVSDSTLVYDQTIKLSLYAEVGIANYWIVNLNAQQVERYSQPYQTAQGEFGYLNKQIFLANQAIAIPEFEDVILDLNKIFPGLIEA